MTSKQLTGLYDRLTDTYDYRPLLKQIKESQETHIVLDCEFDRIESILVQAREIELLTDYHNYLVTSLDMDKIYMEQFKDTVSSLIRVTSPPSHRSLSRLIAFAKA